MSRFKINRLKRNFTLIQLRTSLHTEFHIENSIDSMNQKYI